MIDIRILVKIWPFLSAFIIGLGAAKIVIFYHTFEINIIQYLDFSEVFILFFDDILFFTIYFIIPVIIAALFFGHKVSQKSSTAIDDATNKPSRLTRLWAFFKLTSPLLIYLIFGILRNKIDYQFLALFLALLITFQLRIISKKYYGSNLDSTYYNLLTLLIFVAVIGFKKVKREITDINNHEYFGTTLYIKDTIPTVADSNMIFLGKTKEFYYLYDKKKEGALIIPSGEVVRIDLKDKYKGFWGYFNKSISL